MCNRPVCNESSKKGHKFHNTAVVLFSLMIDIEKCEKDRHRVQGFPVMPLLSKSQKLQDQWEKKSMMIGYDLLEEFCWK